MKTRLHLKSSETGFLGIPVIVDGAQIQCSQGTTPSILKATTSSETIEHKRIATESDYKFGKNIFPFGNCKANGNKPCAAKFSAPWFGAFSGGATSGLTKTRHLHLLCRLGCTSFGGIVTITDSCQSIVRVGDADPAWTDAVSHLRELLHNADVELEKIYGAEQGRIEEDGKMTVANHVSAIAGESGLVLAAASAPVILTPAAPAGVAGEVLATGLQAVSAGADLADGMNKQNKKKDMLHQEKVWVTARRNIIERLKDYGAWDEREDTPYVEPSR